MTNIIGVDFSGARDDRNTWVARGRLGSVGRLLLDGAERARREEVFELLRDAATPAVAALDFPFGVPAAFAGYLGVRSDSICPADLLDVCRLVANMSDGQFIQARNDFVANHGEPRRAGDAKYHRESFSPLHRVNPNMVPMTYHGMRMLHRLHGSRPTRWHVPPLEPTTPPAETVTLLELMPGAFLKTIGLPYKGYKNGRSALQQRDTILAGLSAKSGVILPNLETVADDCRANHDCLDSVVAAVAAAAWALDERRFGHPADDELADAGLEGWIYVPRRGCVDAVRGG